MDQKIISQEEIKSSSLTKQHQRQKKLDGITQKDQQQASEEKEGIEIQGEPQSETKKNQRGPYKQYEDANLILEKIRYYRTQRYPDSQIMDLLEG